MRKLHCFLLLMFPFCFYSQMELPINQKDSLGKQGHWIYYGKDRPESGIPLEGKVEEGLYFNDRKEGTWIKYHLDGKTIKLIGSYVNNRPSGKYKTYYENGVLKSRGTYLKNNYVDTLFRFANTGDTTEIIVFDTQGKVLDTLCYAPLENESIACSYPATKTITITKFRPNGKNKVYNEDNRVWQEGQFKNGKLWDGKVYVYDRDGILLQIEIYKDGLFHTLLKTN